MTRTDKLMGVCWTGETAVLYTKSTETLKYHLVFISQLHVKRDQSMQVWVHDLDLNFLFFFLTLLRKHDVIWVICIAPWENPLRGHTVVWYFPLYIVGNTRHNLLALKCERETFACRWVHSYSTERYCTFIAYSTYEKTVLPNCKELYVCNGIQALTLIIIFISLCVTTWGTVKITCGISTHHLFTQTISVHTNLSEKKSLIHSVICLLISAFLFINVLFRSF